jgi:hypothetical protein
LLGGVSQQAPKRPPETACRGRGNPTIKAAA